MAIKEKGWEHDEYTIARAHGIAARTALFPDDATYFRIVDCRGSHERELMYWSSDEWCEDSTAIGAVFAAIGMIADGSFDPDQEMYQRHADACDDTEE